MHAAGIVGKIATLGAKTTARVFAFKVGIVATVVDYGCDYLDRDK